jgi:predicted nucleic acid binding AN1-type Zn finger protein
LCDEHSLRQDCACAGLFIIRSVSGPPDFRKRHIKMAASATKKQVVGRRKQRGGATN